MQTVRYAMRGLRKNLSFSLAVVATLSIAIAANVAVFTVTSALLLKPLPYHDPHRLVLLDPIHKDDGSSYNFTLNRYELYRDNTRTLAGIAVASTESMNLSGVGEPEQVSVTRVSGNFFRVLGVQPRLGRAFVDDNATPESRPVVMISDALWRTHFGSDPQILGRTVNIDGIPETIIGVLPRDAHFPFVDPGDVWLPRYFEMQLFSTARLRMGVGYLTAVGRLADGTTLSAARSEMEMLHGRYSQTFPTAPDSGTGFAVKTGDLQEQSVGELRTRLLLLSAAVALVLLIAIANAAGLLLSRALARRQEIAIRVALGATRADIVKQLLIECLLLAAGAGAVGLGMALAVTRLLALIAKEQLPEMAFNMDWRVLLFTLSVTLLSGLLFGIVPAMRLSHPDLNSALRVEGTGSTPAAQQRWYRNALVAGQVALSVVLLVGACLVMRSFLHLLRSDAGFNPDGLLTFNVSLPLAKYAKAPQQVAFFDEVLRKVGTVPGVESAAISSTVPLVPKRMTPVLPEGQPEVPLAQRPVITVEMVSPLWFQTVSVPLLNGRAFTEADRVETPKVIVVNQTFAHRYWPNASPIGKHVALGRQPPSEVVGVSADVKNNGLASVAQPEIFIPYAQLSWSNMNLLVRARPGMNATALVPGLRQAVWSVDAEQPVSAAQTGDELISRSRGQARFMTLLFTGFALAALALSMVGIYGLLAYTVAQRGRELAIRMALGASRERVLQLVVRQALAPALAGVCLGLVAAALASRVLSSVLFETAPLDANSFILAPALFLLIATMAAYLPAKKATRMSPLEAMR